MVRLATLDFYIVKAFSCNHFIVTTNFVLPYSKAFVKNPFLAKMWIYPPPPPPPPHTHTPFQVFPYVPKVIMMEVEKPGIHLFQGPLLTTHHFSLFLSVCLLAVFPQRTAFMQTMCQYPSPNIVVLPFTNIQDSLYLFPRHTTPTSNNSKNLSCYPRESNICLITKYNNNFF